MLASLCTATPRSYLVATLSTLPLRPIRLFMPFRTVGPIHLGHTSLVSPLPPMLTGHAVGTVEAAVFPT